MQLASLASTQTSYKSNIETHGKYQPSDIHNEEGHAPKINSGSFYNQINID